MGRCGMSYDSFCSATLREINNVIQGQIEKDKDDIKLAWVTSRYIAWWTIQPHAKEGRYTTPQSLGLFDFEEPITRQFRELTEAEKEQMARWDKEEAEKHGLNIE